MWSGSLLIFLLPLFCTNFCAALYKDQVGLVDWHKQFLGRVKHAVFHTQKAGRKRVIVSTEENVIASLDLRRGDIFWRHVLGENDEVDEIDITLGKYVVTLSSKGSILRAWNLLDGQLAWETFLPVSRSPITPISLLANIRIDKENLVIVFTGQCIFAISSIDGEILWKKQFINEGYVQFLLQPLDNGLISAVGFSESSQLVLYHIDVKRGETLRQSTTNIPGVVFGQASFVSENMIVALGSTESSIVLINVQGETPRFNQWHISELLLDFSGSAAIFPLKFTGMFALKIDSSIAIIRINEGNMLEFVKKVDGPGAISDGLLLSEDEQAFAVVHHIESKINLKVMRGISYDNELIDESIEMDSQRGIVQRVFINNYVRTDRSHGFRALIVMEDHSLLLIQQGDIVWSREDGLASIVDVQGFDLPVEKEAVSVAKVEENLFEWLKGHMLKLKGSLMLANPDDLVAIQEMRLKSSEKNKMTRDHNGFRKLLIVLTKAGKVLALHTGDGRIVWSLLLPSLRKSESCQHPIGLKLFPWQVPHHHAMDENPSILVIGKCELELDAKGILSFVDSYTGREINSIFLSHSISQVIPLPFTDSYEQRLHLLIDTNKRAFLYPRTIESLQIFQQELSNIYWYSVEVDMGNLKGYTLRGRASELGDEYRFDSRELWSIAFPLESEKIAITVTRPPNEVIHTQTKVVEDKDVMYKYTSKNILFVATVSPKASGSIGSSSPDEASLVVYLIETVTGRILHRLTHHGSQGPVNAVLSENWVVYHYFNLKAHRYEMSVIEIYDKSRMDNKDVLKLILGKHNLTSPISSYSRPEVTVKSQSYFFTHSIKTMSVSLTAKGITSKQLLIGTVGDQVLALDKRYVDPRRSVNPTQAEREEGIVPLTESLPIIPQSYATHSLQVEGLRRVVSIPAKLESTSLVFAYGVDIFFTRIAPSRTYDSLTEDFSYALLLITIVGLVAAIFVTWILSERKDINDKWR